MFHKNFFILAAIFALALLVRLWQLNAFPVGFHIDEASLGYNGYSLLQTGKDENNNAFPLYIDMFGDNRPSGYHYLTIVPIKIFGLTEFATRLPGALFGAISVFAIFFLTFVLFKDTKVALLSSFLLAIAPWHIVLSRASAETIVALFFILVGFAFLFQFIQTQNRKKLILATFLLAASFFFYHTPRIFVPFFFLVAFLFLAKKTQLRIELVALASLVAIVLLLIFAVPGGTGRFSQVNIFTSPGTKLVMEEQIREDGVPGVKLWETRLFHNKVVNYSLTYINNYFEYFTGNFLFIKGGLPPWYIVPNMGLLYLVELPFIIFGLYLLIFSKERIHKIPLLWLLAGPLVAAVTVDDIPNIQRAIIMFPMFEIIAAYGFVNLAAKRKPLFTIIVSLFLFANVSYFTHQYFIHAKVHRPWYRNNGVGQMVEDVKALYDKYDAVVITKSTGGIYSLILFYMQFSPTEYQRLGSPKDKDFSGFGKFVFVPTDCPSINYDKRFPKVQKILYIDKGECSKDTKVYTYKDILREDGTPAYHIAIAYE